MIVVFTDLDGTLLDAETYSWEGAREALEELRRQGVPWIPVSSKTRVEIEGLRREMDHTHPFVVENGAAAYIPAGYFGSASPSPLIRDGYEVLQWGKPYEEVVAALRAAAQSSGCRVTGFHDMPVEDIAASTGLPAGRAALAKAREYDEPFLAHDRRRVPELLSAINRAGFQWTHGGRFYHVSGDNNKAKAVRALVELFQRRHSVVVSVGLGDSLNDLPMLESVDIPVLIRSARPPSVRFRSIGAQYTREPGPAGWSEAIQEILKRTAGSVPRT